jgi:hypothetical protein
VRSAELQPGAINNFDLTRSQKPETRNQKPETRNFGALRFPTVSKLTFEVGNPEIDPFKKMRNSPHALLKWLLSSRKRRGLTTNRGV